MVSKDRLLTLDVMRGLSIAAMILVNNPGSWSHVYAPFKHSAWHGCTPTDLIFPLFLMMVGISINLSFKKLEQQPSTKIFHKIVRRTILIFIIGTALHAYPFYTSDYQNFRIMGVLQRISIVYFFTSTLALCLNKKHLFMLTLCILIGYNLIFIFFGGANPYALENNIAQKIDLLIIGKDHLWSGYSIPFDPEGLLSTIPAIATGIIGYLLTELITLKRVKHLLILGSTLILTAYLWSLFFPINKSLWTSSYVLYTAGQAAILFALLIWLIEIKSIRFWCKPAVAFGSNPLFLYALAWILSVTLDRIILIELNSESIIGARTWLYDYFFVILFGNTMGSLLYAVCFLLINWLVGWILYRYKILIKI